MVRAIKDEYGVRRGCFVRLSPHVRGERKGQMKRILEAEGFQEDRSERPYRTLMLDLAPSLEELRRNLLQRWRRHLNKAEKGSLTVVEGTSDELFETFLTLATEMCERKGLSSLAGYRRYRQIQRALPEFLRMRIFVCQNAGEPVAVTIGSAVGNTGIYMLGATGQAGLALDASYLAHWRMIQWLKSTDRRYYDLGAINPQLNPGGYFFKQGIAGKSGWDETYLHRFSGSFTLRSRVAASFLRCSQLLRRAR
jgi:lipid II:glycine glycyltransferase (peptidoglycan interpeptide bridge formation enzyme)